jgi:hypothetical protein
MYNDEIDDDFEFNHIKNFCRRFVQLPDINQQISCGMHNLVLNQIHIFEKTSPPLSMNNNNGNRSIQFPIRVVLAAKRFAKRIFERRNILQQLTTTSLID